MSKVPLDRSMAAKSGLRLLHALAVPVATAFSFQVVPASVVQQVPKGFIDGRQLRAVEAVAREAVASGETPGLAVGLVSSGRLVLCKGYGKANLELGTLVTPDTVFNVFSVTKTFTASGIMQLVERGHMALDDPISRYLPAFPGGAVTVRQLLNHTSGIHDYVDAYPQLPLLGATPDQLVSEYISRQTPIFAFEPGTMYLYSNSNYVLLGKVIEGVSGRPYRDFIAQSVFPRAGLRSTAVDRNEDVVPRRASGYVPRPGSPGGFGNAYLREMLAPSRLKDGRLSGDAPWDKSLRPGSFGNYGLGIRSYSLDGHRVTGPGGTWSHFSSKVSYYLDDDLLIVVLANTGGRAAPIEERIARKILRPRTPALLGQRLRCGYAPSKQNLHHHL
jgi:CubicO group peptidase (beta-lactamase class C family)